MVPCRWIILLFVVLSLPAAARAQATRPATRPLASEYPADGPAVRALTTRPTTMGVAELAAEAIIDFHDALEAGDVAKLRNLIWVNDDPMSDEADAPAVGVARPGYATSGPAATQPGLWELRIYARGRELFVTFVAARNKLRDAARARFGAEGARLSPSFGVVLPDGLKADLVKYVQVSDVTRDVIVAVPGANRPMILRQGPQGNWQIVLSIVDDLANSPLRRLGGNTRIQVLVERTRALETVATLIQEGKLATVAEAEAKLMELMVAAPRNAPPLDLRPGRIRLVPPAP